MTALVECVPERLAVLIADCPRFQSLVGAADRTAALARIHIPDAVDNGDHPLPRAIINPNLGRLDRRKVGIGAWVLEGELQISFELDVPSAVLDGVPYAAVEATSRTYVATEVGEIMDEMEALAGTGEGMPGETHINIESIETIEGPDAYVQEETLVEDPDAVPIEWFAIVGVTFR